MEGVVVVPAFKRHAALTRLLRSICESELPNTVDIILSLDGDFSREVEEVSEYFCKNSRFENVRIIKQQHNLGLRKHIVLCMQYAFNYDFIVILEDDLFVSPDFYVYSRKAIGHYALNQDIAGIALYSPELNELNGLKFNPINDGSCGYFMQIPCSWGQVWTTKHVQDFLEWYGAKNCNDLFSINGLPELVKNWPASSWKKYFYGYMIECGKTFFYPHQSRSTNFADPGGEHMKYGSNKMQVSLPYPNAKFTYDFPEIRATNIKYDGYMEISPRYFGYEIENTCVDLSGAKPLELIKQSEFCLTSKVTNQSCNSFGIVMRPIEQNIIFNISGDALHYAESKYVTTASRAHRVLLHNLNFDPLRFDLLPQLIKLGIIKIRNKLMKW